MTFLHTLATTASWFTVVIFALCVCAVVSPELDEFGHGTPASSSPDVVNCTMVYLFIPAIVATAWLFYAGGGF